MSELISQFIHLLDEFNDLGSRAENQLSVKGQQDRDDGDLPVYVGFWRKVIQESRETTQKIQLLLPGFPNNKVGFSQQLAFYRSLSRYVAESPPVWSAYYPEINRLLDQIAIQLDDIDEVYKLGWYRDN